MDPVLFPGTEGKMSKKTGFILGNHGNVFVLQPVTRQANTWAQKRVAQESREYAGGIVIEPRHLDDILQRIKEAGMIVIGTQGGLPH